MTPLPERPFFIVGHPRSGTTLLRFMLASHPRLYVPEETGFIPFLVKPGQVKAPLTLAQVEKILARIGQLNFMWRDKVKDIPAFYASLPEPRLDHLLDTLFRSYSADHPVTRWGDKTPLYVQYIRLLNDIFPEAQFIHLIRDGRDAALSARQKWPENTVYMDGYYLLKNWVRNIQAGQQAGQWLGKARYFELYYEILVNKPQETLEAMCAFLGEDFHSAMLDHTALAREIGPGPANHTEVLKPVSTSSVGRWKAKMSPFEKKLADVVAGPTLSSMGYELANAGPFSAQEQIRYAYLAAKFAAADSLRRALYATGILTLNRTMRQE